MITMTTHATLTPRARVAFLYLRLSTLLVLASCGTGTNVPVDGAADRPPDREASDSSSAAETNGGGGGSDAAVTLDAPTGDGGDTTDTTDTDSFAAAGGAGGSCNDLTVSGILIMQMAAAGPPPIPAGGNISDGTYVLTRYNVYPPASPSVAPIRTRYQVSGSSLEVATGGGAIISKSNYSTSISGAFLSLTGTCPPRAGISIPFTATATELLIFNGSDYVQTFTKQ
jgi:hypothetical protein